MHIGMILMMVMIGVGVLTSFDTDSTLAIPSPQELRTLQGRVEAIEHTLTPRSRRANIEIMIRVGDAVSTVVQFDPVVKDYAPAMKDLRAGDTVVAYVADNRLWGLTRGGEQLLSYQQVLGYIEPWRDSQGDKGRLVLGIVAPATLLLLAISMLLRWHFGAWHSSNKSWYERTMKR